MHGNCIICISFQTSSKFSEKIVNNIQTPQDSLLFEGTQQNQPNLFGKADYFASLQIVLGNKLGNRKQILSISTLTYQLISASKSNETASEEKKNCNETCTNGSRGHNHEER